MWPVSELYCYIVSRWQFFEEADEWRRVIWNLVVSPGYSMPFARCQSCSRRHPIVAMFKRRGHHGHNRDAHGRWDLKHGRIFINGGSPKYIVYNGIAYFNGWYSGTSIFENLHVPADFGNSRGGLSMHFEHEPSASTSVFFCRRDEWPVKNQFAFHFTTMVDMQSTSPLLHQSEGYTQ